MHNDPFNMIDPNGQDSLQLGVNIQVGPLRWGWGSYRVGKEKGDVLRPSSSSIGRYSSSGGGLGLALGIEVQATYCETCFGVSDIAGKSAGLQVDLGLGGGIGETSAKEVPDGFGGTMIAGGTGKQTVSGSIGASAGFVPIGRDTTKVTPSGGVEGKSSTENKSWWTTPQDVLLRK